MTGPQWTPTDRSPTKLVVVDAEGRLFARVSTFKLGIAVWRTTQDPLERDLGGSTLILVNADQALSWEAVCDCARRTPTIIATSTPSLPQALEAIRSGALGYLDMAVDDEALLRTLLGALRGELAYTRSAVGVWLESQRRPEPAGVAVRLTERQRQIVELIATGSTDRDIAQRLGIRTATAQKHVANMLRRLRVRNRAQAVGLMLTDPSPATAPRPGTPRR